MSEKRKRGRPSKFTKALASRICEERSNGLSMRQICALDGMPTVETLRVWKKEKDDFSAQYEMAFLEHAKNEADEILQVADNEDIDANSRRVRIDARKWVLCKLLPKIYGDKIDVQHTGKVKVVIGGDA